MTTLYQRRNIYLRQQTTPLIANAVLSGVFFFMTLPLLLVFRALVWSWLPVIQRMEHHAPTAQLLDRGRLSPLADQTTGTC